MPARQVGLASPPGAPPGSFGYYFLLNDGQDHFTVDPTRVPPSLVQRIQLHTDEMIDDRDILGKWHRVLQR